MKYGLAVLLAVLLGGTTAWGKAVQVQTVEATARVEVGAPIVTVNDDLLVPAQRLLEGMGFTVSVEGGAISAELDGVQVFLGERRHTLVLQDGEDRKIVPLEMAPIRVNETLCVPLSAVSAMGYAVSASGSDVRVSGQLSSWKPEEGGDETTSESGSDGDGVRESPDVEEGLGYSEDIGS